MDKIFKYAEYVGSIAEHMAAKEIAHADMHEKINKDTLSDIAWIFDKLHSVICGAIEYKKYIDRNGHHNQDESEEISFSDNPKRSI